MINRRHFTTGVVGAAMAGTSAAQAYPARPLTFLVPYPPGGPGDLMARSVGEVLAERLGQPVLVDNRPGAGGQIAGAALLKGAPDGYTLMLGDTSTLGINKVIYRNFAWDPVREVRGIAPMLVMPMVLLVPRSSPFGSLAELVSAAKGRGLNYASQGSGSTGHLLAEMLRESAVGKFNHIPYKGSAPAMTDLLGGQVDMLFDGVGPALQYLKADKLKVLAVASPRRLAQLPEVPTTAELGYPGVALSIWFGAIARKATPDAIVKRLNAEVAYAMTQPKVVKRFGDLGFQFMAMSADQFSQFIKAEADKWGGFVRARHITGD